MRQVTDAEQLVRLAVGQGLRPEPILTVSEWAERHRRLSSKASAEPGPWRNAKTPYLREIMDALSARSPVQKVVFMKGAQVGGTEAGNNWIGYVIDQAPGPMLMVQPTVETMRRVSRQRVEPMIQETPRLREKVAPPRGKDGQSTAFAKDFRGGVLVMTGANSAVGLRSMPARYLFLDEIDGYPGDVDGEGDPVTLAERRTSTFPRSKILMVSTPTLAGESRIEREWERSDQRYYLVPCPECGHFQRLRWGQIKYELDADKQVVSVHYACSGCGVLLPETAKSSMLANGRWEATRPGRRIRGYHLSALYSPLGWYSWWQAVEKFLQVKNNPHELMTFVNTVLGEVWQERGEAPDWTGLKQRAEQYRIGLVPAGAKVLTAGVDVQRDRLEASIIGWGPGHESWIVEWRVLPGDPESPAVWQELDQLLLEEWPTEEGGRASVAMLAVDSGFATQAVYNWVRGKDPGRVIAVRGRAGLRMILAPPRAVDVHRSGKSVKFRGAKVWEVGVDVVKGELYGWLRQQPPTDPQDPYPPGFVHFPAGLPDEYYQQLTAEHRVERRRKDNRTFYEWKKVRERNEALDTFVYGRAALYHLGAHRWTPERWQALGGMARVPAAPGGIQGAGRRRTRRGGGLFNRGDARGDD